MDGGSGRRESGVYSMIVVVCFRMLQCFAIDGSNWWMAGLGEGRVGFAVCCSVMPYVEVCCSMLQCVAINGSDWWMADLGEGRVGFAVCCSVVICCSVLHCVAVCCIVLQRVMDG